MRVSSVQLEIKDRAKPETVRHVLSLLRQTRGSDLVLLPEMWPCGFLAYDRYELDAEPMDGPTVWAVAEQARAIGAYVLMGSFVERDGSELFNTRVLLDRDGAVAACYRKVHLFGHGAEERRRLRPGREAVTAPTPWGTVGLSICYDLRFPELYRRLVGQGAALFLVASAWPAVRREAWVLFNRARAHENLAYLFSCNAAGTQAGQQYGGHSLFVDPLGRVIAEAGDGEEVLTAEVDPNRVDEVRREFPALADRVFLP